MTARKATATARGAIKLAARAEARVEAGILFPRRGWGQDDGVKRTAAMAMAMEAAMAKAMAMAKAKAMAAAMAMAKAKAKAMAMAMEAAITVATQKQKQKKKQIPGGNDRKNSKGGRSTLRGGGVDGGMVACPG